LSVEGAKVIVLYPPSGAPANYRVTVGVGNGINASAIVRVRA
jgi:hypothetical protein